jgi:3-dehydroquinate synthase
MLIDFGADRKSLLINLGGGVMSDLGGFAASTFKRGIDFVHVPTTLLSQVDASVGGKTGIDIDSIKNIIGTFTQPKAVFIELGFLETLPPRANPIWPGRNAEAWFDTGCRLLGTVKKSDLSVPSAQNWYTVLSP